jgi:hypothetical protein
MNLKLHLLSIKKVFRGILIFSIMIILATSWTWADEIQKDTRDPKVILDDYFSHDLDSRGPVIINFNIEQIRSNEARNAQVKVYYHDIHNRMITFIKPDNLKSTLYLANHFNTWLFMGNMQSPLRISSQQRLFGDAGISEVARIDFVNDYNIDKMSEDDKFITFEISAISKQEPYQKATLIFRKHGLSPDVAVRVRVIIYSNNGLPMKEVKYFDLFELDGFHISNFEIRNLLVKSDSLTKVSFVNIIVHDMPLEAFSPLQIRKFHLLINDNT